MKRSLLIVIVVLLAGAALFGASYFMGRRVCAACVARSTDNLDWLRLEFKLSDAEMARIRELHENYMPKCAEMCAQIAAKKRELDQALAGATNISEAAKQKLTELAVLRSQCQAQMLDHFITVSRAMPPEQGRQYLAEIERLTIGAHEQTEQTMSENTPVTCMENTDSHAQDRADMERLMAGQDTALNDLMERHATPIFQFLCRMVGNEEDAGDLAQETFARVFRARASFRINDRFSTWLYTIAANLARNHFRWRARHPNISLDTATDNPEQTLGNMLPAPDPSPGEQTITAERAAIVRAEVSRLPEDLRAAIVLCEWQEQSVAEAAAILETTPKAVESRLYRARKVLRERLTRWF